MNDRNVKSLKDKLHRQEHAHQQTLKAKNDELRILRELGPAGGLHRSFPHLLDLLSLLVLVHDGAAVLRSPTFEPRSPGYGDPTGTHAANGSADRARVSQIDARIGSWAEWLRDQLGDRGELDERGPQCWNPDCLGRAVFQPFDAETCAHCGHAFSDFRYKPVYLRERRRCGLRSCEGRDRVGACEHSA